MEFEKLFSAVVLGGSLLAGGCAKKATESSPETPPAETTKTTETPPADGAEAAVDCEKICTTGDGREVFCPDPSNNDIENCCWLMVKRHECCES